MFLTAKLPQSLQHLQLALRLDPSHEPAMQLWRRVNVERLKEEGNLAFKANSLQPAVDKYGEALGVCDPHLRRPLAYAFCRESGGATKRAKKVNYELLY
jgi:hypothetical protein